MGIIPTMPTKTLVPNKTLPNKLRYQKRISAMQRSKNQQRPKLGKNCSQTLLSFSFTWKIFLHLLSKKEVFLHPWFVNSKQTSKIDKKNERFLMEKETQTIFSTLAKHYNCSNWWERASTLVLFIERCSLFPGVKLLSPLMGRLVPSLRTNEEWGKVILSPIFCLISWLMVWLQC
jgi:hypothetical protein